ncbi:MAG: serine/threonine-protein kinase [Planctomycetota bacterium]
MDNLDPLADHDPRPDEAALANDETVHRDVSASPRPPSTRSVPGELNADLEAAKTVIRVGEEDVSSTPASTGRTPAEVAKVLIGQQLNQYFLEELIGGGGMGAVFRAHDQQLDRIVALKVIPFVSGDAEVQRRFRNEAQNAAKLDHPRIARVFDAGSHAEWHYIVFEYIQGTNLRDLVDHGGVLPLDDAVFVTQQVAEALDHASQRGIVHRDIKPSNVLIGDDGTAKLVDMGLARSDNLELSEDMTASGVTLGTFDYISPEQALDPRDADVRSDIYSLGCTFYYMLTGEAPYIGGTMLQKLLSHGNAPLPDPRSLRSELPDEVIAVMHRMMAKDPKTRYQNASDLLGDLAELAHRFGLKRARSRSVFVAPTSNPGLERISIHLPWVTAVALMFLVGGYLELQSLATRDAWFITPPNRLSAASSVATPNRGDNPPPTSTSDREKLSPESDLGTNEPNATDQSVPTDAATSNPEIRFPTEVPMGDGFRRADGNAEPTSPESVTEPTGDSLANAAANGPPAQTIRIIASPSPIDEIPRDGDGALLVSDLPSAIELAAATGVRRIEIAVPKLVTGPFEIPADNMEIVSTVGRTAIQLVTPELLSIQRTEMIRVGDRRASFQGLDFHWELLDDPVDGASMFAINDNRSVRLMDCTLTMANLGTDERVAFFHVVTDPEALAAPEVVAPVVSEQSSLPLVAIELENAVVRGAASLIEMDRAAALQLVWRNGLLAVSGRMIETSGARLRPSLGTSPMRLTLSNLTAEIPKGLLRMRMDDGGPHSIPIERSATRCVFVVDDTQPHVEIVGAETLTPQRPFLLLTGEENAYDVTPTLTGAMLEATDLEQNTEAFAMADLLSDPPPAWWLERLPQWTVYWNSPVRPAPYHEQLPQDYRQDGAGFGGFREIDLPDLSARATE